MNTTNRSRGSVLMMVVGLLTIIVMLGATFLIISHLDARSSEALATKAPADEIAGGIVGQLQNTLVDRLKIGAAGPYASAAAGGQSWGAFADIPEEGADLAAYLSSNWFANVNTAGKAWTHLSNIANLSAASVKGVATTNADLVDSDADGIPDAVLYYTGITNNRGVPYYAAVRVTDLSGRICVNTAGEAPNNRFGALDAAYNQALETNPCNTSLRGVFKDATGNDTAYNSLHNMRCNGATIAIDAYSQAVARRPFVPVILTITSPLLGKPFSIADEMYLRYYDANAATNSGLLYGIMNTTALNASSYRHDLTTYSVSRSIVRRPKSAADTAFPAAGDIRTRAALSFTKTSASGYGTTNRFTDAGATGDAMRASVYRQLVNMMTDLSKNADADKQLGSTLDVRKKMAAHFVANLWAYQSTDVCTDPVSSSATPWVFNPKTHAGDTLDYTAYGVIQQVVFTEVFAYHKPESAPGAKDDYRGYAFEVFNPGPHKANFAGGNGADTLGYTLIVQIGGTTVPVTITKAQPLAKGDRMVFYSFFKGANSTATAADVFGAGCPAADWMNIPQLDFEDSTMKISLFRGVSPGTVFLDDLNSSDFIYSYDGTAPKGVAWKRDDDLSRARYNIASWDKVYTDPATGAPPVQHLGGAKGVGSMANLDPQNIYSEPILEGKGSAKDIAEFMGIYFAGHAKNDTGNWVQSFAKVMANSPESVFKDEYTRGARGRFALFPVGVMANGWCRANANDAGAYPEIPHPCMLSEFFDLVSVDTSKHDGSLLQKADLWTKVYGRVNINTAEAPVLRRLPWPAKITFKGTDYNLSGTPGGDIDRAIEFILAYRDMRKVAGTTVDYTVRNWNGTGAVIANLRAAGVRGFLSPDEVAIPLAHFSMLKIGYSDLGVAFDANAARAFTQAPDFLVARDAMWRAISNVITVNSDAYCATIVVQLGKTNPTAVYRYMAVFDRSNCHYKGDLPYTLIYTDVK